MLNLESLKASALKAKKYCEEATPDPWFQEDSDECLITNRYEDIAVTNDREFFSVGFITQRCQKNAAFIVAARSLLPELADAVLELMEYAARLEEEIDAGYDALVCGCGEKLAIAREALTFYGEPENYSYGSLEDDIHESDDFEPGWKAREALRAIGDVDDPPSNKT